MLRTTLALAALALASTTALAAPLVVTPRDITEWKSVYATVEARTQVPARARIGGTVTEITVTEGDDVAAGAQIGKVVDPKLDFQLAATDAQIASAQAQLDNAQTELARGDALVTRGSATAQSQDALRTRVDVVNGQMLSLRANRDTIVQTKLEGDVLAPAQGTVLSVPVTAGEVILPGETMALIGTGGFFLRLQVPEHYASGLATGTQIPLVDAQGAKTGRLSKIYPLIAGGRVQADVEVDGLDARYIGARIAVRLPVGLRPALLVPQSALTHRGGLDYLTVQTAAGPQERAVLPGETQAGDGPALVEILSGIDAGETVLVP